MKGCLVHICVSEREAVKRVSVSPSSCHVPCLRLVNSFCGRESKERRGLVSSRDETETRRPDGVCVSMWTLRFRFLLPLKTLRVSPLLESGRECLRTHFYYRMFLKVPILVGYMYWAKNRKQPNSALVE